MKRNALWTGMLCLLTAATVATAAAPAEDGALTPPTAAAAEPVASSDAKTAAPAAAADPANQPAGGSADQDQLDLLLKGATELESGRRTDAIKIFDEIIAHYATAHPDPNVVIYCARDSTEALLYAALAAKGHKSARVIGRAWADALMLKGYALVELGEVKEARNMVETAVALSPLNAQYLAELGYLHQMDHRWEDSLDTYRLSAEASQATSSADRKKPDLARALRGQGYALTELGRFDEAEALYRQCLDLDQNDTKARNELEYIRDTREKLKDPSRDKR